MSSIIKEQRTPIKNQQIQDEREGKEERLEAKRSQLQEQVQQKHPASFEDARASSSQPAASGESNSPSSGAGQSGDSQDEGKESKPSSSSSSSSSVPAGVDRSLLALYTLPPPVAIPPNSIHLTYLHSFLSATECASLLTLAEGDFTRSETTGSGVDSDRTSSSAGLPQIDPTVHVIRSRVAQLCGAKEAAVEKLQVVRYEPGQQYKPHYDSGLHAGWKPRQFTIFALGSISRNARIRFLTCLSMTAGSW